MKITAILVLVASSVASLHVARALFPGRNNILKQIMLHNFTISKGSHHLGQIMNFVSSGSVSNAADYEGDCTPGFKQEEASLEVLRALSGGEHAECASTVRHYQGENKDIRGRYNVPFSREGDKIVGMGTLYVDTALLSDRVPDTVLAVLTVHGFRDISVIRVVDGGRELCLAFDLSCVFHHQRTMFGEARFPVSVDVMCRYGKGDYQPCGFRLIQNPFAIVHYFHEETDTASCAQFSANKRLSC